MEKVKHPNTLTTKQKRKIKNRKKRFKTILYCTIIYQINEIKKQTKHHDCGVLFDS